MKAITELFPRVIPYAPGCSDPLAAQSLLDSAIAFCEDSLVMREPIDEFPTIAGEATYQIDAPVQQQVARVMELWVDGFQLEAVPYEAIDKLVRPGETATGMPRAFYTTRRDSELRVNLYPTPDRAYTIRGEIATRPARKATQLEDDLVDLWMDPIVAGALARIRAVPNQPFSDPPGSLYMANQAAVMSRRARVEGSYGRVKGNLTVKQRPFSRGKQWP